MAEVASETEQLKKEVAKRRRDLFEAELAAARAKFAAEESEREAMDILSQRRERDAARQAEQVHRRL